MNIIVSGSHIENFPQAEDYAKKKVARLGKYHSKIDKITVRLIEEKAHRNQNHDFVCEIIVSVPGKDLEIVDKDLSADMAIDKALDRMKRLLIKSKEKQITKKHRLGVLSKFLERF